MRKRIGLRDVRALGPGQTIWDGAVPGFGARRQKGSGVSYMLFYRTREGRQRWYTIGRHGAPWTPETARSEAQRLLGEVAGGGDPAAEKRAIRKAITVSDLCDRYLAEVEQGRLLTRSKTPKRPSTVLNDRGRVERHIKPLLGRLKITTVISEDIDEFLHAVAEGKTAGRIKTEKRYGLANVRGGKTTASRTTGLLGSIFSYAVKLRIRPDNPVHGVTRFADSKRMRRLSDEEYGILGTALRNADYTWPPAIAAARFLALTGWRSGEALRLRWGEVDLARRTATLSDTKTGRSLRPLPHAACDLLRDTPRTSDLVFPPTRGSGIMRFPKFWARIAKQLPPDVTPHTLRHSFASLAADLGYSESTIAALVGHKGRTMTSRYMHAADAVLLAAADAVANRTVELMGESRPAQIIALSVQRSRDGMRS